MRAALVVFWWALVSADVFMTIEYDTEKNVPKIVFNLSLSIVDMVATFVGCDDGFYDLLLNANITCLECQCQTFQASRVEDFIVVNT